MKKLITPLLILMILCGCTAKQQEVNEINPDDQTQQPEGPYKTYESMEELEKVMGYGIEAPEELEGYGGYAIQTEKDRIIQLVYGDENSVGGTIAVRKVKGTGYDISGDSREFTVIENWPLSEDAVVDEDGNFDSDLFAHISYIDGKVANITWTMDGYSYAVVSQKGFDGGTLTSVLIDSIS